MKFGNITGHQNVKCTKWKHIEKPGKADSPIVNKACYIIQLFKFWSYISDEKMKIILVTVEKFSMHVLNGCFDLRLQQQILWRHGWEDCCITSDNKTYFFNFHDLVEQDSSVYTVYVRKAECGNNREINLTVLETESTEGEFLFLIFFWKFEQPSLGAATGCMGPDPTNFWESNRDPPNFVLQSNSSLPPGPYHLFNPGSTPATK